MVNFIGIDLSGQCCKPIAIYDKQDEPTWMKSWWDTPEDIQQRLLDTLSTLNQGFCGGLGKVDLGYQSDKEKAVIIAAVPAGCSEIQRRSIRAAAKAKGFRIKRFVGASAAAALGSYWKTGCPEDARVLVCTMGECFEAAVLDCGSGIIETCSQAWDLYLNEDSFSQRLANGLMGTVSRKVGVSVDPNSDTAQKLRSLADSAVKALNEKQETTVNLSGIQGMSEMTILLSRNRLREISTDLGLRIQRVIRQALEEADQEASALHQILLVGAAGMDAVRQAVAEAVGVEHFEKTVLTAGEDSIAKGAAYQAEEAVGGFSLVWLMDSVPMSLGIESEDGKALKLVEKGSVLPIHKVQTFTTSNRFDTVLNILEGEEEQAQSNTCIDRYWIKSTPGERDNFRFDVHFDVDADGILSVTVRDAETGVLLELYPTSASWEKRSFPVPAEEKETPPAPKPKEEAWLPKGIAVPGSEIVSKAPPTITAYLEGKQDTILALLPVYDDLERAMNQPTSDAAYKKGVELTMRKITDILKRLGAEPYGRVGETFDPKLHEATVHIHDINLGTNVISQVYCRGFRLDGRIIRYAMVQVAN